MENEILLRRLIDLSIKNYVMLKNNEGMLHELLGRLEDGDTEEVHTQRSEDFKKGLTKEVWQKIKEDKFFGENYL